MTKDKDGAVAMAGLVAFEMPTNVFKPESVPTLLNLKVTAVDPSFPQIRNVFIGILCGVRLAKRTPALHHGQSGRFAILAKLLGEVQDVPEA